MRDKRPQTLTDQLRGFLTESGHSLGQLSKETGVDKSALSRFLNGERGVSAKVLDVLGLYLELELRKRKAPRVKKGR